MDELVYVNRQKDSVRVIVDNGPVIEFDGQWNAIVKVPDFYRSNTTGICGNNNGNADDDFEPVNKWKVFEPEDPL